MPTSNLTEDVEFLTAVDSNNRLIRRPRFVRRPRRVNGRNVPGNARYYRRRERELGARPRTAERLANRRAAQRAGARRAPATARRAQSAPPAGGERRGGIVNRLRSAAGRLARNVENRARQRRERRSR